ncbi:MAG: coenzyme F420-0:L-glutamate ligase [Actinomycetota bacterium]
MNEIRVLPVVGIPEVSRGDDLAELIVEAWGPNLEDRDVLVVAQKVVSKAEGRLVDAADRSAVAVKESSRILRRSGEMIIAETFHGFVCANAGVDSSNVPEGKVALLPLDSDLSARRIHQKVLRATGKHVAVIISDTFGRAWRLGQTNVAIGVAGMDPFIDYRGTYDTQGRELRATRIAIADELAGAAEMVMRKRDGICAAVVRGAPIVLGRGAARDIARPHQQDLFR